MATNKPRIEFYGDAKVAAWLATQPNKTKAINEAISAYIDGVGGGGTTDVFALIYDSIEKLDGKLDRISTVLEAYK